MALDGRRTKAAVLGRGVRATGSPRERGSAPGSFAAGAKSPGPEASVWLTVVGSRWIFTPVPEGGLGHRPVGPGLSGSAFAAVPSRVVFSIVHDKLGGGVAGETPRLLGPSLGYGGDSQPTGECLVSSSERITTLLPEPGCCSPSLEARAGHASDVDGRCADHAAMSSRRTGTRRADALPVSGPGAPLGDVDCEYR